MVTDLDRLSARRDREARHHLERVAEGRFEIRSLLTRRGVDVMHLVRVREGGQEVEVVVAEVDVERQVGAGLVHDVDRVETARMGILKRLGGGLVEIDADREVACSRSRRRVVGEQDNAVRHRIGGVAELGLERGDDVVARAADRAGEFLAAVRRDIEVDQVGARSARDRAEAVFAGVTRDLEEEDAFAAGRESRGSGDPAGVEDGGIRVTVCERIRAGVGPVGVGVGVVRELVDIVHRIAAGRVLVDLRDLFDVLDVVDLLGPGEYLGVVRLVAVDLMQREERVVVGEVFTREETDGTALDNVEVDAVLGELVIGVGRPEDACRFRDGDVLFRDLGVHEVQTVDVGRTGQRLGQLQDRLVVNVGLLRVGQGVEGPVVGIDVGDPPERQRQVRRARGRRPRAARVLDVVAVVREPIGAVLIIERPVDARRLGEFQPVVVGQPIGRLPDRGEQFAVLVPPEVRQVCVGRIGDRVGLGLLVLFKIQIVVARTDL